MVASRSPGAGKSAGALLRQGEKTDNFYFIKNNNMICI